ncbi:hypothetical protein, partial [Cardiobacterium hominis]|uniref:hypothetical protein n=1 Tax=Cardiobacterium hominis TaxID=2718 RepID=UPI0028898469
MQANRIPPRGGRGCLPVFLRTVRQGAPYDGLYFLRAVMTLFSGCAVLCRFAVGLLPRPNPPSPGEGALWRHFVFLLSVYIHLSAQGVC